MLQRELDRTNALAGLSFWSQVIRNDTLLRSKMPVSLVRSDRARAWGVAADAPTAARG
jgi:hypothetical protein